jgi:N-acetyl-anhydromuramyl-L-alanine amidase AmpD
VEERDGEPVVHQLLPLDVMGRAAFGANLDAVSIELVARNEDDLLAKPRLLETAAALTAELMAAYGIGADGVWGHSEVDAALAADTGGPFFDRTIKGAFVPRKIDPGPRVMAYIRERISR